MTTGSDDDGGTPANIHELKQSFTLRYFIFFALTTFLASSIGYFVPRILEKPEEEKRLWVSNYPSQNFIELPNHLANQFEFFQTVTEKQKHQIKSLFGYRISISNASQVSVDNVTLYLYPPKNVKLVGPPVIRTASRALQTSVIDSSKALDGDGVSFVIDFLDSKQSVTFTYLGISSELMQEPTYLSTDARKNGWKINNFEAGYDPSILLWKTGGYPDGTYSDYSEPIVEKRLSDYTAGEAVQLLLLLLLMCVVVAAAAWLLVRSWSAWGVNFLDRVFKRVPRK